MSISNLRKAELATMNLPSDKETRDRIRRFLHNSGLSMGEMAAMMEFATSSLSRFLSGEYHSDHDSNTMEFRRAAKQLMDLHEVAEKVRLDHTHYVTADFRDIRASALNALRNGVAYVVDGPPGTQKTESLRRVEHEINTTIGKGRALYVYARVGHTPQAFLKECCRVAGIPHNGLIDQLLSKLRFFLAKERVLLMIDEAQHLGHDGLENLRLLLDLPPYFGILLAGSHDLTQRLQHWQMEQWRSRLRRTLQLTGPSDAEAKQILVAELGDMSLGDLNETLAACRATAQRVEQLRGRPVTKTFQYLSARQLFGAIQEAKQILDLAPGEEKASAA